MTEITRITIETDRPYQATDVTDLVMRAVPAGHPAVVVSVPHTTCALFLSEVDDELLRDLERVGETLLGQFEPFTHARNGIANGAAHIVSSIFGTSVVLTVGDGTLQLGRYQRIVLLELDGPKQRLLEVQEIRA
ncbi:MAG: YjbQ family protein [Pseudolysinimonas sp.]|uniref:YjbQ family protein n=1 Tax=Pseudolysinimonas sp. TaxID=2680009 RepID=UPI003C729703